ncbi:M20/M25/M40 family metallo-hydrolase [Acidisoma cellulosilytica]|uniref:M20/M25/M40 family metallo-hydrolase n=1 Tax=Acidisoma cellulosilyticum TaxID=2802395 RepID=A0A963Z3V7_9PROT|nr:M20/M25/M40 family metallo-hydrolase [Acidisoma cellulosilyticum]MCB8881442.1 M20/M25/M40 family metallo-hydrolase [Acidisoma cellulosilyticum]
MTMLRDRLKAALDPDAAIDRLKRLVHCPSVTGQEDDIAALLEVDLQTLGLDEVTRWAFATGRFNVRARRSIASDRPTVLLVGHTDTVHVRGWQERWAGTDRANAFAATEVDGEIWGRGTADMKIGIATALSAIDLLNRAGIAPSCNLQLAFVGDEESGEPGSGVSAGMKALMPVYDTGLWPIPDLAIYGEPSSLDVYTAHMGFFICDITVNGKSAYFGLPEQGVDALKAGNAILTALWQLSDEIRAAGSDPMIGPGFLVVTGVNAGGYIAVPGDCRISLIRKLIPGEDAEVERQRLETVVRNAITDDLITVTFGYPAGRDSSIGGTPLVTDAAVPAIGMLIDAIRSVVPAAGRIGPCAGWSEGPFLSARGAPVVYFSPGDFVHCHTLEERVSLGAYADGILALAIFLASYGQTTA